MKELLVQINLPFERKFFFFEVKSLQISPLYFDRDVVLGFLRCDLLQQKAFANYRRLGLAYLAFANDQ